MKNNKSANKHPPFTDPLLTFYKKAKGDHRLSPMHISLFTAILVTHCQNHSKPSAPFNRHELMQLSKIIGNSTYYRCIKELNRFGYIEYSPAYDPRGRCLIHLPSINANHK